MAGYVSTLVEYFDNYSSEVRERWNYAMHDIKRGNYGTNQLISDVCYVWAYGVMGFVPFGPAFMATSPFSTPIAVVTIEHGVDPAVGSVDVRAPGSSNPKLVSDLRSIAGKSIPTSAVSLRFVDASRTKLEVKINGLSGLGLNADEGYRGTVTLDDVPLAHIDAVVKSSP